MLEHLLVNLENMQLRRNTLDPIWFVDLGIYVLESLIERLQFRMAGILHKTPLLPNVLLPVKERPGVGFTLYGAT
jgi:hypothetical protein